MLKKTIFTFWNTFWTHQSGLYVTHDQMVMYNEQTKNILLSRYVDMALERANVRHLSIRLRVHTVNSLRRDNATLFLRSVWKHCFIKWSNGLILSRSSRMYNHIWRSIQLMRRRSTVVKMYDVIYNSFVCFFFHQMALKSKRIFNNYCYFV